MSNRREGKRAKNRTRHQIEQSLLEAQETSAGPPEKGPPAVNLRDDGDEHGPDVSEDVSTDSWSGVRETSDEELYQLYYPESSSEDAPPEFEEASGETSEDEGASEDAPREFEEASGEASEDEGASEDAPREFEEASEDEGASEDAPPVSEEFPVEPGGSGLAGEEQGRGFRFPWPSKSQVAVGLLVLVFVSGSWAVLTGDGDGDRGKDISQQAIGALPEPGQPEQPVQPSEDAQFVKADAANRQPVEALQTELRVAREQLAAAKSELDQLRDRFDAGARELDEARSHIESQAAELKTAQGRLEAQGKELEQARSLLEAKSDEAEQLAAARAKADKAAERAADQLAALKAKKAEETPAGELAGKIEELKATIAQDSKINDDQDAIIKALYRIVVSKYKEDMLAADDRKAFESTVKALEKLNKHIESLNATEQPKELDR